jgi:glycosyltransferase involved in cell wall biosynthesis
VRKWPTYKTNLQWLLKPNCTENLDRGGPLSMKILVALTYYYPHWTGLTAYAQRLAEGLAARGHQVTVITSHFRPDLALEEEHKGVRILRAPSLFRLSRGQVSPGLLRNAWRLVREHDIVQTHTPMLETWPIAALAHRAGRPLLMTHHGDLVMPKGLWDQFVQKTVGYMLDRGARAADVISTHCQDYANHSDYLHPYLDKLVAIYPPVEIPQPNEQAVAEWRASLGLNGAPLIGFAGRFVEEKGFDYLLQAIPYIVERIPDAHFVYAGERAVYEDFFQRWQPLIDQNQERVHMVGLITDAQKMANFYAMCDVFALPSRTDCFPSVQIEAMLCGTPVVATDIPGAREVVTVTGMGLLVEPRNPRALANGLTAVLQNAQQYTQPRHVIRSIFDTSKCVEAYEQLMDRMLPKS